MLGVLLVLPKGSWGDKGWGQTEVGGPGVEVGQRAGFPEVLGRGKKNYDSSVCSVSKRYK